MEQFQILMGMMGKMATKDDITELCGEIHDSENRTKVFIENTVTKRIDSLVDGFKLTHEKQFELERKNEELQT